MTDADSLVRGWVLARFREEYGPNGYGGPASWMHLAVCPETVATEPTHAWDCGCYSEFTRDDEWIIHAKLLCPHTDPRDVIDCRHSIRGYQMPDILGQLAALAAADDENDPCKYAEGVPRC